MDASITFAFFSEFWKVKLTTLEEWIYLLSLLVLNPSIDFHGGNCTIKKKLINLSVTKGVLEKIQTTYR